MTIFQAPEYDFKKARRRKITISIAVAVVIVLGIFAWIYRNWPEEHIANKFFTALQQKDYKKAYGVWVADPNWEKKPPLARYTFSDFHRDWGPSGDWGEIKTFKIDGSTRRLSSWTRKTTP
jgi:hypothetical protein